jgi:glucose-1-phosphatase
LVRTGDFRPREALAAKFGITRMELEELVFGGESGTHAQLGLIDNKQHWEHIQRALQLSQTELSDFQFTFWGADYLDEPLVAYIRNLRTRYKIGLLSNNFPNLRKLITDTWKIADAFDEMIISAEIGVLKPEAQAYQIAMDKLDVQAAETIFIDDFEHNLAGARAVGIQTILFRSSEQVIHDLNQMLGECV